MTTWIAAWLFSFSLFAQENPLQVTAKLSSEKITPQQIALVKLNLHLPDGYFAYADKFKLNVVSPDGFKIKGFNIDPLKEFLDVNSKEKKMGVIKEATLIAPFEAPVTLSSKDQTLLLQLQYQACTKTYCLFPITVDVSIPFFFDGPVTTSPERSFFSLEFSEVIGHGLPLALLFVFIAGILTSLTPCIYPMIPITLTILGQHAHLRRKRHNFALSLIYVLGISVTYSALGVFAAGTGALFGSFMSHPIVLSVICIIFFAMALSMFGLYDIQPPAFLRNKLSGDLHVHGYSGIFTYGVVAGAIASPCVGPVLVGILTYVAKTQSLWQGFLLLFVFALGMGQLFIALGVFSQFTKLLPKSGPWMDGVKHFFGLLMSGAFYYYLSLLVPARWFDGLLGIGLVVGASLLGAFTPVDKLNTWGRLRKGLCMVLIFVGAAFITMAIFDLKPKPAASQTVTSIWRDYSDSELQLAAKDGRPVLIDFWADWCAACHELDEKTFSSPLFQDLASKFVLLKFNASGNSDQLTALKEKYQIVGLPTVLFFDGKGKWRKDLTVNEFVEPKIFTEKMKDLIEGR